MDGYWTKLQNHIYPFFSFGKSYFSMISFTEISVPGKNKKFTLITAVPQSDHNSLLVFELKYNIKVYNTLQ